MNCMKGTTHIIGGITTAVIAHQYFNVTIQAPILFYSAAAMGSIIPDICHPKSTIGRMVPAFSKVVNQIFGHRSLSHSLLFLLLIYWLLNFLQFAGSTSIQTGVLFGMGSHMLLDAMTTQGIKFFYPLQMKIRTPLYVRTGSLIGERLVVASLITLTVVAVIS